MKKIYIKIYIVILAAVSAYMSNAAYLNWQVDTNSDGPGAAKVATTCKPMIML